MSFQKCAIEGCQYAGVSSYSAGRYYCDFHAELFDCMLTAHRQQGISYAESVRCFIERYHIESIIY